MPSKKWTKDEVRKLYQYAEQTSQLEAARRLGRSYHSVKNKAKRLGIVWFQGFVSSQDVADLAGVSRRCALRFIEQHFPGGIPHVGKGKKPRIRISIDDADEIAKKIREVSGKEYWSLSRVAGVVGCDVGTVRRLVRILYHDREMFYFSGKRKVYRIEEGDAERLIKVLRGTRELRRHNILGGKACHANKKDSG